MNNNIAKMNKAPYALKINFALPKNYSTFTNLVSMAILKQLNPSYFPFSLHQLYHIIHTLELQLKRLSVSDSSNIIDTTERKEIINPKTIILIQSNGNCSRIHLEEGTNIYTSKTLKYIQQLLPENIFLKIQASHLIRKYTARLIKHQDFRNLVLNNGQIIPFSRK
jgi:DNA-binding LytR/AlgR family response regulator